MGKKYCIGLLLVSYAGSLASHAMFHSVYPFASFKSIVDVCVKSYTDVLLIQDRLYAHEKIDEQVDLLVGRLMRLKSYIEQAIHAYQYEATITYEELDYLMRMLEYLEVTFEETRYRPVAEELNKVIDQFKHQLRSALNQHYLAWHTPTFFWQPMTFAFFPCCSCFA